MTDTQTTTTSIDALRPASRQLAALTADDRRNLLTAVADALAESGDSVLSANEHDVEQARGDGVSVALLDRLELNPDRYSSIVDAVRDVAALDDPLGEVLEERTLVSGIRLRKVRVPFGVVCVVYEARPNVTADAAAIALRTGNAILLRGSRQAVRTNTAMVQAIRRALTESGVTANAVQLYDPNDRDGFRDLIASEGSVDLLIPRGGEGLKRFLYQHARVPILAAAGGNCHVYVDEHVDADMAVAVVLNAKTQRPGVCNAAETLLVHEHHVGGLLPRLEEALRGTGVEIRTDEESWATEFLDLIIAVRVVASLDQAIDHINTYGTGHSEAIITSDPAAGRRFQQEVDAACVYVNASTRFTDGGEFGMGAEVGISTNRLHARGPIGLRELTTTTYWLDGDGQVRGQ